MPVVVLHLTQRKSRAPAEASKGSILRLETVGNARDTAFFGASSLDDPRSNFDRLSFESGGRDGIRTHDLLIANEEKSEIRHGAAIT